MATFPSGWSVTPPVMTPTNRCAPGWGSYTQTALPERASAVTSIRFPVTLSTIGVGASLMLGDARAGKRATVALTIAPVVGSVWPPHGEPTGEPGAFAVGLGIADVGPTGTGHIKPLVPDDWIGIRTTYPWAPTGCVKYPADGSKQ